MVRKSSASRLWALALLGLTACGGGGTPGNGTTFSDVYPAIIGMRCAPCHSGASPGNMFGKLDMSSLDAAYSNLVGVKAAGTSCGPSGLTRVVPGSAQNSLMYQKVAAKLPGSQLNICGDPMPGDMSVLTQAQVDLIASWINEGAQR